MGSLTGRFSTWQRQQLKETLRRLERKIGSNCVKFRRRNRKYAVKIRQEGSKCSATVGYVRSRTGQRMNLIRLHWGYLQSCSRNNTHALLLCRSNLALTAERN